MRNYAEVLITGGTYGVRGRFPPIVKYLVNSLIASICVAFITCFLGTMAGHAILRYRIRGTALANWILSLRMIPPVVVLYPLVIMTKILALMVRFEDLS